MRVVYVQDRESGLKLLASQAWFVPTPRASSSAFLLKDAATRWAQASTAGARFRRRRGSRDARRVGYSERGQARMSAVLVPESPRRPRDTALAASRPRAELVRSGRRHRRVRAAVASLTATHARLGFVTFANVPAPIAVARGRPRPARDAKLGRAPGLSACGASLAGFVAAAVVGSSLGLAIGRFARAPRLLLPPLELLRPIPAVAWIPLAILMFPSSEMSMMFITFIGALFPILLNTIHGVEGVDRAWWPPRAASAPAAGDVPR